MKPPRDDGEDFMGDYGCFSALPAIVAFWLIVATAWLLGSALYDVLLACPVLP